MPRKWLLRNNLKKMNWRPRDDEYVPFLHTH